MGHYDEDHMYEPFPLPEEEDKSFASPGSRSALRASSQHNPRNLPCPTCGAKNRLTRTDVARRYQCDACADRAEGGGW